MRSSSEIESARLAFAFICLASVRDGARPQADAGKDSLARLVSVLAGAVPHLREHGIAFGLAEWFGKGTPQSDLAGWCFEWFGKHEALRLIKPDPPKKTVDRVKWLLERTPAESRFLARESEELLERLKAVAIGYQQARERAAS